MSVNCMKQKIKSQYNFIQNREAGMIPNNFKFSHESSFIIAFLPL